MAFHELWAGGPCYEGESVQTDALSLCSFAEPPRRGRGADLGCGCGILMLLLCWEYPDIGMDGVELRADALRAAEENFKRNGLSGRCRVFEGDLRHTPLGKNTYDFIVTNPPYFAPGAGAASPDGERELSRRESADLTELCTAAAGLLKSGGRFFAVYTASRLPELLSAMEGAGLTPKRLRCVQHDIRHAPSLVLCEGRKGGRSGVKWEPTLLLRNEDGSESAESLRMTHWEKGVTL